MKTTSEQLSQQKQLPGIYKETKSVQQHQFNHYCGPANKSPLVVCLDDARATIRGDHRRQGGPCSQTLPGLKEKATDPATPLPKRLEAGISCHQRRVDPATLLLRGSSDQLPPHCLGEARVQITSSQAAVVGVWISGGGSGPRVEGGSCVEYPVRASPYRPSQEALGELCGRPTPWASV